MQIHVAEIAYDRPPTYERWAFGQARNFASDWASIESFIKKAGEKGRIKGTADSQRGRKNSNGASQPKAVVPEQTNAQDTAVAVPSQ